MLIALFTVKLVRLERYQKTGILAYAFAMTALTILTAFLHYWIKDHCFVDRLALRFIAVLDVAFILTMTIRDMKWSKWKAEQEKEKEGN